MTNEDIKKDNLDENKELENENIEDVVKEDEVQDESQEVIDESSDDEKYQALMDKFMRLQADFANYKRRTEAQKTEFVELGVKKVVNDLLPVIDNFERALDSIVDRIQLMTG